MTDVEQRLRAAKGKTEEGNMSKMFAQLMRDAEDELHRLGGTTEGRMATRELSLAQTKLDEARHWVAEHRATNPLPPDRADEG